MWKLDESVLLSSVVLPLGQRTNLELNGEERQQKMRLEYPCNLNKISLCLFAFYFLY